MSTHYDHKALMDTIKELDKSFKVSKKKQPSKSEVRSEWERLAGFMKQRK